MAIENTVGLVLALVLVGWVMYLFITDINEPVESVDQAPEESHNQQFCPTCGNSAEENSSFCLTCGHPLIEEKQGKKLCTDCHTEVDASDKFCGGCGKSVGA